MPLFAALTYFVSFVYGFVLLFTVFIDPCCARADAVLKDCDLNSDEVLAREKDSTVMVRGR